jgi:hypothetical protein
VWYEASGREKSQNLIITNLAMAHEMVPYLESIPSRISPKAEIAFCLIRPEFLALLRLLLALGEAIGPLPAIIISNYSTPRSTL